jgi:hypothetical protein
MFTKLFTNKLSLGTRKFSNTNANANLNTSNIEQLLKSLNVGILVVALNIVCTNYILVQQSKK